jgi:hypothetical protein
MESLTLVNENTEDIDEKLIKNAKILQNQG